ncbi:MAG TPA: ABC transporter permease [Solirubrobacterales bacterium]|nr:ABC transporter permease [Solirubrobacterales bacterium]
MGATPSITHGGALEAPPRRRVPWRAAARKLLGAIVVLWAAATLCFAMQELSPGSPALAILGGSGARPTQQQIEATEEKYGLNDPILERYGTFISNLATGDLGTSYQYKQPVTTVISEQVGPTLVLIFVSTALAWLIAVPVTLLTAGRGRLRSSLGSGFEAFFAGVPPYWLGLVLLVVFAFELGWFPTIGGTSPDALLLPALTLALPLAGFLGQVTRDEFERGLKQPFAVSARTRGASEGEVRRRHVLRHALLPGITLTGWAIGATISGAVLVEVIYARPGLGQVLVNAVSNQDLPVVVGITILVALIYVAVNLLVDLLYAVVDPRLRTRTGVA